MTADAAATRRAVWIAAATSMFVIAHHIAGKATRDALFLSTFPVTSLPRMVVAAAVVSLVAIVATSRAMRRWGPGKLVPGAFAVSGALFLVEWALSGPFRAGTAVLVYLHLGALGALLISGFWSMVSERFDPHTAKLQVGRIAAGGTLGGVVGGVMAERMAALSSLTWMLPVLAGLHIACALLAYSLSSPGRSSGASSGVSRAAGRRKGDGSPQESGASDSGGSSSVAETLARVPYLRNLAILALLGTMSEGLIDYVFKSEATAALGEGDELLRLFALFYMTVSVVTFLLQSFATRPALEKLGLARTVSSYPGVTVLGGLGALAFPGLPSAAIARGSEAIFSNSLYRSGTELLFSPIPRDEKRATKSFIDVGAVRVGDILAALGIELLLFLGTGGTHAILLTGAVALGAVGVVLASRLQRGYVDALQKSLVARGDALDLAEAARSTQTALLQTMGAVRMTDLGLDLSELRDRLDEADELELGDVAEADGGDDARDGPTDAVVAPGMGDPVLARARELRSGDAERVRQVLSRPENLTAEDVAHLIPLLAWDEVMLDVMQVLRRVAHRHVGQLLDALLDEDQPFAIRRRVPLVLSRSRSARVFRGLVEGLDDKRFEVRFRCGQALNRIRAHDSSLKLKEARALDLIYREADVDERIWESRRILDELDDEGTSENPLDVVVRQRANRGLQHVFNLLALYLPPEPVQVALRGLLTDDPFLRGTAIEYLDTVLRPDVRDKLWPFLKPDQVKRPTSRSREEVMEELLKSNASIVANLQAFLSGQDEEDGAGDEGQRAESDGPDGRGGQDEEPDDG